jgi:adenine-specific DNA-methyltransferase
MAFNKIKEQFSADLTFKDSNAILINGDSLAAIKKIPDQTISLILTDPPYHTTKKKNITNDTAFETDDEFLEWLEMFSKEWHRILKPNGSIYVYCSSAMAARIEVLMMKRFNILSHIVWTKPNDPGFDGWKQKTKKESLRQWYDHSERIIFAEPAYPGNLNKSSFGHFLKSVRVESNMTTNKLTELTGAYGKVNHGGSAANWEAGRNIPSRDQYSKICEAILSCGKVKKMPFYEDVIRPFNVNSNIQFTDVWDFFSVRPYNGKHPAEKPIDMLEHSIISASYEGDIVLDCFAGSGSTAIAALNTGRKSISIELDPKWVYAINKRLENYTEDYSKLLIKKNHDISKFIKTKNKEGERKLLSLF